MTNRPCCYGFKANIVHINGMRDGPKTRIILSDSLYAHPSIIISEDDELTLVIPRSVPIFPLSLGTHAILRLLHVDLATPVSLSPVHSLLLHHPQVGQASTGLEGSLCQATGAVQSRHILHLMPHVFAITVGRG